MQHVDGMRDSGVSWLSIQLSVIEPCASPARSVPVDSKDRPADSIGLENVASRVPSWSPLPARSALAHNDPSHRPAAASDAGEQFDLPRPPRPSRPASRPAGQPSEDPVATARSTETLAAAVSSLQGALATLTEQLIRERDRAVDQVGRIEKERDALQGQVDALSAKLADAQTELAAARDQAEAASAEAAAAQMAQAEAEADAAELRQAEASRKGRGRLARLRAAWRGV
jgi:hypothetical protein